MSQLPKLSKKEIRDWTDSRSFSRGEDYFEGGMISNPRLRGDQLVAECRGSASTPYRVEMTLGETGIVAGYCSCPVGESGDCKHCVALLLTWLHEPGEFVTQEMMQNRLADRSREELVALLEQMMDRYPELATLLEMPIAGVSAPTITLDPAVVRRQVDSAVDLVGYDDRRRGAYGDANQLYLIAGQGRDYLAAGEWANGVVVFATLAEGVMESYEEMFDDEGDIVTVVDDCAAELGLCLKSVTDPDLRNQILQTLFAIYQWDLAQGGLGGGDAAYAGLQAETTTDEKAEIAGWVHTELSVQRGAGQSSWRMQALGGFLLQLEAETLTDEAYLHLCRETNRTKDLVVRLLALGRSIEAAEATVEAPDHEFLTLNKLIYAAGHTQLAEQLLRDKLERVETRPALAILQQMIEWTLARDAAAEALPLARRLLDESQTLAAYQQVRGIAASIGYWPETQSDLLRKLEAQNNYSFLTQIYVDEKRAADALAALAQAEKSQPQRYYGTSTPLRLSVAKMAEESHPHAAIDIFLAEVQREIKGRQRESYASAARYLRQVKTIYSRLDEIGAWDALISQLRQENKRLRALQDELVKAGL